MMTTQQKDRKDLEAAALHYDGQAESFTATVQRLQDELQQYRDKIAPQGDPSAGQALYMSRQAETIRDLQDYHQAAEQVIDVLIYWMQQARALAAEAHQDEQYLQLKKQLQTERRRADHYSRLLDMLGWRQDRRHYITGGDGFKELIRHQSLADARRKYDF